MAFPLTCIPDRSHRVNRKTFPPGCKCRPDSTKKKLSVIPYAIPPSPILYRLALTYPPYKEYQATSHLIWSCSHQNGKHINSAINWKSDIKSNSDFSGRITQELHRSKKRGYRQKPITPYFIGARGWNRTNDSRIRNPVLYPLSYAGKMDFLNSWHNT